MNTVIVARVVKIAIYCWLKTGKQSKRFCFESPSVLCMSEIMDTINEQIDVANELHPLIGVGLSIILTVIGYYIVKYTKKDSGLCCNVN